MTAKERIDDALKNPYVRAVLDMLAEAEVGPAAFDENKGYNIIFGGGRFNSYEAHPNQRVGLPGRFGGGNYSTASGRYQILNTTANDLAKRYGIEGFSPEAQDRMAVALMIDTNALEHILQGDIETALPLLGKRWASINSSTLGDQPRRNKDFLLTSYSRALSRHTNEQPAPVIPDTSTSSPNQGGVIAGSPTPGTTPPSLNFPITLPDLSNLDVSRLTAMIEEQTRKDLAARQRRPLMVTTGGPLTPENTQAMAQTLFAPRPEELVSPIPDSGHEQPVIVRQLPVSRGQEDVGYSSPMMSAMLELLSEPERQGATPPAPLQQSMEEYLHSWLQRDTTQAQPESVLRLAGLNYPYAAQLLRLVDNTTVRQ